MASVQKVASPGSSSDQDQRYAMYDDKKRKRMISNRESARRSRMRKQQHVEELCSQKTQLLKEQSTYKQQIDSLSQAFTKVSAENDVLRARYDELVKRLKAANDIIQSQANCLLQYRANDLLQPQANELVQYRASDLQCQAKYGTAFDIPEIPDVLLEPWQLPFSTQSFITSADMLHY